MSETTVNIRNQDFYTKRFSPTSGDRPRALLIAVHGFAEHASRYDHVWPLFAAQDIEVLAYDQRGYGKTSPGKAYGNTELSEQLSDLAEIVRMERKRLDEIWKDGEKGRCPIYIYGHSMGGGITLCFACLPQLAKTDITDAQKHIDGVIASSPWILLTKPPPALLMAVAPLVVKLVPNLPHNEPLDPHALSHNPETASSYTNDPLISGKVRLKTVVNQLIAGPKLMSKGTKNWPEKLPVLITHGTDDPITSSKASKEFIDRIKADDKEIKLWPNALHEVHNELPEVRDAFIQYSIDWVKARTPPVAARL